MRAWPVHLIAVALGVLASCQTSPTDDSAAPAKAATQPAASSRKAPPPTRDVLYRVNCGATDAYTDTTGAVWLADQRDTDDAEWGAVGGSTVARADRDIPGAAAPKIYLTERYGMTAYRFAVPNGVYEVDLHFAETYAAISAAGQRVFDVAINGTDKLEGIDPYACGDGQAKPCVKTVASVRVTDGSLYIAFVARVQQPEINGIEIIRVR